MLVRCEVDGSPMVIDNVIDLEVGQTRKSDTPARYFRDKSIF